MTDVFGGLAGVLVLAAVGGVAAKALKQPAIIGYLAAGLLISASGWRGYGNNEQIIRLLGTMGVTLLLFLAGMELPLSELRRMGKVSLITGICQIIITSLVGWGISRILGFGPAESVFLGIGLTFGSTILVIKLLSEKGETQSLHGKIAMGYLLVQDFVAIGLLVVLAGTNGGQATPIDIVLIAVKAAAMTAGAVWLSEKVLKQAVDYLGESTETLFISSIGWCLAVAAIAASPWVGFSVEIGGFLAGLSLAATVEHAQIISRIRPLRDFFLTWFFVSMGAGVTLSQISRMWLPSLIMSVYVIAGNPLIVMAILGALGYRKRTMFMASLAVGQISEFSLILAVGAVAAKQAGSEILIILTTVAMITMTTSAYVITHAEKIYKSFGSKIADLFEKKQSSNITNEAEQSMPENHAVLFGHNRMGSIIRPALERLGFEVIVVDFNPAVIEKLKQQNINAVFGDMADHELFQSLNLEKAKLVISTVPDATDEAQFLEELSGSRKKSSPRRQTVILTARDTEGAKTLYRVGADYVLVPHLVGGEYLAGILEKHISDADFITREGKRHRGMIGA